MKSVVLSVLFSLILSVVYAQNETKPFKPEKGMVNLSSLGTKKVTLKVGQKAYIQYKMHASVGIWADVTSSDESVLKIVKTHTRFHQKQVAGMAGGDASTVTVIFEAVKAGNSQVKCINKFRSEIEKETEVAIEVK
jgi:predicted secreted protein